MRRIVFIFLISQCFYNFCVGELSFEKKDKYLTAFVDYLNNLPDQPYTYDDGTLLKASETDTNNVWNIEARVKATELDTFKFLKCTGTVRETGEGDVSVDRGYQCEDDPKATAVPVVDIEELVTEGLRRRPVKLENEVESGTTATSGEQFIAVPRHRPSAPCIGCSDFVNPEAEGVPALAALGILQLDFYQPSIAHSLKKVLSVERQVQAVNGVRYILTLLVDYNSCPAGETTGCTDTKTCKVSILEKPWVKLSDGSKYRTVVANNCTGDWIFRDGEQFNGNISNDDRDKADDGPRPTPDYEKIPNTGSIDDNIKVVHSPDVQAQPGLEKMLTEEEIKNIEDQIVPNSEFTLPAPVTARPEAADDYFPDQQQEQHVQTEHFFGESAASAPQPSDYGASNSIPEDKKKAIDDLINFFEFASFDPKVDFKDTTRTKRSYKDDIKAFNLAEKFSKMKKSIENAKHLYILAQIMVDYLNEIDLEVKNRVLKSVLAAEEESDTNQHFYYVQARVVIPCQKAKCDGEDNLNKICSSVIDSTNERTPQVLSVFCYNEQKPNSKVGKINQIPHDDAVLKTLTTAALKKIESELPDANALKIIKLVGANTQKVSGILTRIAFLVGFTNCSKTEPFHKRINCTVLDSMGSKMCNVEVLERKWIKTKKISYVCTDRPVSESFTDSKRPYVKTNDRSVQEIVQEALQYLEVQSSRNNKQKLVEIKSVSTQLVAGLLTNVEFSVGYTSCANDADIDVESCEVIASEPLRICQAQIWQRPWLEDGRQMNVTCDNAVTPKKSQAIQDESDVQLRKKRSIGTENPKRFITGGPTEQDPKNPVYLDLAKESWQKYLQVSGSSQPHVVTSVEKVTTQVVSGSLTKIDFTATAPNSDVIRCHSEVWEQSWLNKKEITVNCQIDNNNVRDKRGIPGGNVEKNPNDPHYRVLAEESLQKYKQTTDSSQAHVVTTVEKVTTQVVSGSLTKIDFTATAPNSDVIRCHSEVWEQSWLNKKEITVNCQIDNKNVRDKREVVPGGEFEQNPNEPRYRALAEESLQKYKQTTGSAKSHIVTTVEKVLTQVVSGSLTKIDFTATAPNSDVIRCHSEVWEQSWLNKKEISVNCQIDNKNVRDKREVVPGGEFEQNPNEPRYRALAEESLQKYKQTTGSSQAHVVTTVEKVLTQVVSGSLTKIDFIATAPNSDVIRCHSEVWEQSWLKKKEITVNCQIDGKNVRDKRGVVVPGGEFEQNPNEPRYRALADESLQKYKQSTGSAQSHVVTTVEKVLTQVVSGSLTKIDFTATAPNSDVIRCHSDVWEQPWLNKKEITVNCQIDNNNVRDKRGIPGGNVEKNPNDPHYRALAEESLQKYKQTTGSAQSHVVTTVEKVLTQVVSGSLTKIDFTATAPNSDVIRCHSDVWEQPWLNKKEITVNCQIDDKNVRDKREVVPGGEFEQNPNEPRYRALADESLQKYKQTSGSAQSHVVTTVEKVLTQVVSGSLTKIDFTATAPNSDVIRCHSEVWEQSWLKKKEITVNCQIDNNNVRVKRQITGGQQNEDPNDPHYRELAEKSLQKYKQTAGGAQSHAVTSVDSVTTQVVSGTLTRINFTATATTSDVILCYSEIWEQPWLNKTEIDVNCKINDNTSVKKRSAYYIEKYDNSDQNASSKKQDDNLDANEGMTGELVTQNPDSPENKKLAEQCLTAFLKYKNTSQHHKVIQIDKVTTQVVAGVVTRLAFLVSPTDCQIGSDGRPSADICTVLDPDDIQRCTAKVWDKPWKKKKVITVNCRPRRDKREILGYRFKKHNGRLVAKVGSFVEQNASRADFRQLADESLRKYQRLQATDVRHKVIDVKRVFTKVVSGTIYKIDYTATPIKCQMNGVACARPDDNSILYCHAEIWDRPWLHRKNIDVTCNIYDTEENYEEHGEERIKRGLLGGAIAQDVTAERYHEMAEIATKKFQQSIHSKYRHKVMKIYNVFEQVIDGFFVTIEFTISPTTCLIKDDIKDISKCSILDPKVTLLCSAEIQERLALDFDEDVRVNCKRRNGSKKVPQSGKLRLKRDVGVREKRQNRVDDDDFIDDDTKFYYADRAIKYINDHSGSQNIQKLVTVHSTQSSMAMKTQIVRMYIETAYTFCLRNERDKDIKECDELDGMGHRLCLVKIFPSADDELVINRIKVVCEDDQDFARVTGLSIPDLVAFSIKELERSPKLKYKLVHQGEPNVGPSLDQNVPVKVHFITVSTNCSKTVDLSKEDVKCVVDETRPAKSCLSYIWLIPDARVITQCIVQCKEPKRFKREIPDNPALRTTDDLLIQKFVQESLEKLEMSSLHRYKQRVLQINSYSAKITSGKVTTIDFDVGYTNCLKYEWIDNITKCEFLEHLPRRHCVSQVWERLWLKNGRSIDVNCEDDETPLESRIEFESAETAMQLARQAVRHIEAKYPHPKKQDVVRIFSLEKQLVAGIHFRMKIEVGFTNCSALSTQRNCHFESDGGLNRFCRVNVWIRPWTDHPPNFRVSCDYQDGVTTELYHQVQAEQLFSDFLATYSPEYINDHVEMEKRFGIFRDNVRKIHELNTHEMGTATYAVTRFADLTVDEFRSKYMGLKPSLRDSNQVPMRQAKIPNISIPDKFDWRSYGAVTGVKDQGSCGSCWAFSVTGNIEGQWKLHSGELVPLSEQELVDCDKLDQGCNGGLPDNAYRSIEQMGGLETESDYPYEGEDDKCAFNKTLSRVQISGAVNISSNETDMAKWLVHNGPISIGINANAMQFYVGGVSHPWRMLCSPKNLDHGVLIVGYGVKDYPLFHKRLPYWIVKNSWGAQWGEQGYYRVFRGDGTCGLNLMASSAVI